MSATPHAEQVGIRKVHVVLRLRCFVCAMPANDPNKLTEVSVKDALSFMVGFSPTLLISIPNKSQALFSKVATAISVVVTGLEGRGGPSIAPLR